MASNPFATITLGEDRGEMTMAKRKKTPPGTETDVLTRSARRCCICFGLAADFTEKQGQIAHLDGDPSNPDFENLAWLCLPHHDKYDGTTSQSKGLTIREVKKYRTRLYEAVDQMRKGIALPVWHVSQDVPLLNFHREIPPSDSIPAKGIQFTNRDPTGSDSLSTLYLSVYFKTSRFFGKYLPPSSEKWLYLQADMRFAFNLRIQVHADERDVFRLMVFLSNNEGKYLPEPLRTVDGEIWEQYLHDFKSGWALHGPRPESDQYKSGDYFRVWRENGENRLTMSTFTPTNASISIQARFSDRVAEEFADYLEEVGFTKPVNE
jgi:hypothetical protein